MAKRITITPRELLLRYVPPRWQGKFAEMAAEIMIDEGRIAEILQLVTGLRLVDLSGESLSLKESHKSEK